ncbi:rhamnulose-1-phosphate aldolase [Streptococcus ictaluri]|uniref:Rhamnulose-1-phosphate aldolase n=1 Tax=Streptococcus ictaluri 707-05 TaxID=764299 RepID=G5K0Z8_9STRE|nr:rhamnulose-1-phosphate aldolase [Streptococcus ictaluri]EHI70441.1 putative rhamnulose-1-phosphate aldolase [Streptococcus ictaluri 707-05]
MDILKTVIQYILDLGAAVFVAFLMLVVGLLMKMKFRDAFSAALTLGIAFTGMGILVNFIMTSMGAAANDLTTHTGISLPAVDIGWPGAANISWAWPYAFLMFPLQLGINFLLLVTNQTKTLNVDLWNVWNKIFTAVIVTYFTNNVFFGFLAAAIIIVLELKLGDVFAPEVERLTGIPGVTVPHFICLIAVLLHPIDELLKKIPLLNKQFDADTLKDKIGIFGENAVMGAIIGFILGLSSGNGIKYAFTLAVQAATALTLFPMVFKLFSQALSPISEVVSEFMRERFEDREVYIGLDWPILAGTDFNSYPKSPEIEVMPIPENMQHQYLLISASWSHFRQLKNQPAVDSGIIRLTQTGYQIIAGFNSGKKPTSEIFMHILAHSARLAVNKDHRVVVHNHATNLVLYSLLNEVTSKSLTLDLWSVLTESIVVFPDGIAVLPWEVPGTRQIGLDTARELKDHRLVVWAKHGVLSTGVDYQDCFGLIETANKAAKIALDLKMISQKNLKECNILTIDNLKEVCQALKVDGKYLD